MRATEQAENRERHVSQRAAVAQGDGAQARQGQAEVRQQTTLVQHQLLQGGPPLQGWQLQPSTNSI